MPPTGAFVNTQTSPSRRRLAAASVLGVSFELLVTALVLLALFAAWLLWWTDVTADREQSASVVSQQESWGDPPDAVAPELRDDVPIVDPGPMNEVWGILHVPSFSRTSVPLAEGVDLDPVLNHIGVGHYPTTQRVGEVGNFAVAGHRTTYGKPLNQIDELEAGDPIVVETADYFFVYRVTDHLIVDPDDNRVIAPVPGDASWSQDPTKRVLTLTACHPDYSLAERYIVHADFDYYTKRSDGVPPDLAGKGIIRTRTGAGEGA